MIDDVILTRLEEFSELIETCPDEDEHTVAIKISNLLAEYDLAWCDLFAHVRDNSMVVAERNPKRLKWIEPENALHAILMCRTFSDVAVLNDWDMSFLVGIQRHLKRGGSLSEKQTAILDSITALCRVAAEAYGYS